MIMFFLHVFFFFLFSSRSVVGLGDSDSVQVSRDYIPKIIAELDSMIKAVVSITNRITNTMQLNPDNEDFYYVPDAQFITNVTSTRRLLWGDFIGHTGNQTYQVGIGNPPDGFLFTYSYRNSVQHYFTCMRQSDANASPDNNYTCYDCDQNNGAGLLPAMKVSKGFDMKVRPWYGYINAYSHEHTTHHRLILLDICSFRRYVNASKPEYYGEVVLTNYFSLGLSSIVMNAAKNFKVNGLNRTIFSEFALADLDTLLLNYCKEGVVCYVMDRNFYTLYATSIGLSLDLKQSALNCSDSYIKQSAEFIVNNKIISDTNRYSSADGFAMEINFYENVEPGLNYTIVAVTSQGVTVYSAPSCNSSSTYGDASTYDDSILKDMAQLTLDIASATLAFSVVTVVGFIAYSYYASVVPSQQVIGKDGKWGENSNPMSK